MKTGFKRILAALAMLFGAALLLVSVHAQSSFTHSNNLIPNSVAAFSVATGGTLNLLAPVPDTTCPKKVAAHGDTADNNGGKGRIDTDAEDDCSNHTSGSENAEDDKDNKKCTNGTVTWLKVIRAGTEAEEKGECDTEKGEKAQFDLIVVKNVLAPDTFVMTWSTAGGATSYMAGTFLDGYRLVP
jgi:hypothetical protein